MLVLGRKAGESIRVGRDILLTVISVQKDGYVRVGIEAPPHVDIVRTEIEHKYPPKENGK
jgi:carbon storage regulator